MKTHIKQRNLELENNHVVKSNLQLSPWDLRRIRSYLTSDFEKNDSQWIENMKLWTMIIVGVRLFLRCDEIISMKTNDFVENLQLINDHGTVNTVAVKVKGKSDKIPQILLIHNDFKCTDLCALKHLLFWMKCSGVQDGYIFR